MRWLVGVCLLLSLTARAEGPTILTLEEALAYGKQNSSSMRISLAKTDAATAKASESRALLLPTVKLDGGYRRLSEIDPFRVQLPVSPSPVTISPVVLDNFTLRAAVQQPIFTGFRLMSNAHAADRLAEASRYDHRNAEADLALNITTAYWRLYQASQQKVFVDENVARLETDARDAENLMRAGLATRSDVLRVQVQLSNARLARVDAAHEVELSMMNLNALIGLPLDTDVAPGSTPDSAGALRPESGVAPPEGLQKWEERALSSRPDVLAMQSRMTASEEAVRTAQGSWWPQVYLAGNYYYSRPNSRIMPTRDEFKGTWDIGIQVQLDIWNWGTTLFQTEQAEAGLAQARALLAQTKDNASLEVRSALLLISRSRERIDVAQLAVNQSEENARETKEKYRAGMATTADLLDADVGLLQSRTTYTSSLVEYELAKARLTRALGISPE